MCLKSKKTISLQQTIIPDYRMGLFCLLRSKWGNAFQIYAGDEDFGGSPVSTKDAWQHFQQVKNSFLFSGRFLWQGSCFGQLLSSDVTILNANMRILSNTIILLLRKICGRRTILWGHSQGRSSAAAAIKGLYLRQCDGFLAYTETQALQLREEYPFLKVWVAANSCVHVQDCTPVEALLDEVDSILYVGRLVESKKVRLLLEGFIIARNNKQFPKSIRLFFIGDGPERSELEALTAAAGLDDCVEFVGHVSNTTKLRKYYSRAICTVSPGYVGLSATQSFSFGIPMVIARDEFHSPEIEACKEGFNAEFFESDDPQSLADSLLSAVLSKNRTISNRKNLSDWTASHYSFEVMQEAFMEAVNRV
ncbi:MAG: glycosyltransferase [Verrucomicrobiota bacterium]|nr:glycosyltransferase [Verrucomicrobiota bacterium]